ncbi:MAG: OmpA family protein [Muribaculaceae bacterium]|nr:OmpA family protein [Muribaculaceae bacterium]
MKLRGLLCAALLFAALPRAVAQDESLDLETNVNTPQLAENRRAEATAHARRLVNSLRGTGMRASTLRGGEVVLASLPCDTLFAANASTPKPEALRRIRGLKSVVEDGRHYKILVAVHADDTGDDEYSDRLTEERATAMDELLWKLADTDDTNVVIYGMGKDEPIYDNDTRANRRANRRVEFYIVPL